MDEPTTHFDIPSREALEQVLLTYPGTILLVSHDRHLVSLLADSLLVMADGKADGFEGTFEEWSYSHKVAETEAAAARVKENLKPDMRLEPVKSQGPKRRNPAAPVIDFEQLIMDLEDRLKEIEALIQQATVNQDFEEMTRLGEEHVQMQARLEQSLDEWDS